LADIATASVRDAALVLGNARRALAGATSRSKRRLRRAVNELAIVVERTRFVVAQARHRLAGRQVPAGSKLVSLHDTDARVIAKGRLGRPVEFGYQAQVIDNEDGVVLDYQLNIGNPPDAPQLAPAIRRIIHRTGRPPHAVAADRGYGEAAVERDLHALGVKTVAIPRKGKPGTARREHEHRPRFRELVKWRTGAEGRISHLKHAYGWDRSRLDGRQRAATWCGHGILAHNLVKITRLAVTQPA
jgi:IS5 family transposase